MYTADYFVKHLDMLPHTEGGFFKEIYASNDDVNIDPNNSTTIISNVSENKIEEGTQVLRKLWTSIYFLLQDGEVSNFHRIKSDEMWYYHAGSSLTIYMIDPQGKLIMEELGLDIQNGEKPQILVPKDYIFGSAMNHRGFSLVGCMVAPGFVYEDFELFERNTLLNQYPEYEEVILKLTRE